MNRPATASKTRRCGNRGQGNDVRKFVSEEENRFTGDTKEGRPEESPGDTTHRRIQKAGPTGGCTPVDATY
jgi:hypothetical protein